MPPRTRTRTKSGRNRSESSFTTRDTRTRSFSRQFHSADRDAEGPILDDEQLLAEFVPSTGLTNAEAEKLLLKWGPNELEEKTKSKLTIFIEQFTAPMPIMIWIAIVVEGILENWLDMVILCGLQAVNGGIGYYETTKAGDAVAALKASLQPKAYCKRDGAWGEINAAKLVPGDLVSLGVGGAVPADCRINEGTVDVDQAALTGESMPVTMMEGDVPKMGSTVARGEVEATVIATGMHTFFGKTANLIQSVDELGHLQKILLTIMAALIVISFLLCGTCLWYLLDQGEDFNSAISFVVVILVASIPIAIEVVVTATMALGSRQLTDKGAIVVRLAAIEEMAGMNMLCSDKTGTLTLNKMVIQEDCPTFDPDATADKVLLYSALAAKWWEPPKDALDTMVLNAIDLKLCEPYSQTDYMPFDPTVKRTEATIREQNGTTFKVTKGAPHVLVELCHNKREIQDRVDEKVMELAERGIRSLAVAKTDKQGRWVMQGILTFLDPPRPDTKRTIELARVYGVDVKMVTGDHQVIAAETARQLDMGDNILGCEELPSIPEGQQLPDNMDELGDLILECNGFAQVFPEHKFLIIEALQQKGYTCGMTGDGVNDAPALKKADIGIAVAGSTAAARAAADIVLTEPGLMTVVDALLTSRKIFSRMKSFILYRIACTLQIVVFFFIAVLFFHPEHYDSSFPSFWTFPVLALIIITLLNDGTIISIAYDNVYPNTNPEVWNLPVCFTISTVLGTVAFASSVLLLYLTLSSNSSGTFLNDFGLELDFEQVCGAMYLQISVTDFLTLFSARTRGMFFTQPPGKVLFAAACFSMTCSTVLALTWPFGEDMSAISWKTALVVWCYCLITFLIQDILKTLTYMLMEKYNILGINNSRSVVDEKYRQDPQAGSEEQKDNRAEGMKILDNMFTKGKSKTKNDDLSENLIEGQQEQV